MGDGKWLEKVSYHDSDDGASEYIEFAKNKYCTGDYFIYKDDIVHSASNISKFFDKKTCLNIITERLSRIQNTEPQTSMIDEEDQNAKTEDE